jgi:hypothetical protein
MNKSICVLFISLLFCGMVTASSINYSKNTMLFDELDQSQTQTNGGRLLGTYSNAKWQLAQSFVPQKGILTRVELYLSREEVVPATQPFYLAIRESLTGATLTEASISASSVPISNPAWKEFDFPDIPVNAGEEYFLVGYSPDVPNNGFFFWSGIDTDTYVNGITYISGDVGVTWDPDYGYDLCFKTYGLTNDPPEKPSITGTVKGVPDVPYNYTFTAVEPDGENIKYVIDWADGNQEETVYVSSGESITMSHTWADRGRYTIQAKAVDVVGKESEWGTLNIQMPTTYTIEPWWQWLEQQFPLLARLFHFVFSPELNLSN